VIWKLQKGAADMGSCVTYTTAVLDQTLTPFLPLTAQPADGHQVPFAMFSQRNIPEHKQTALTLTTQLFIERPVDSQKNTVTFPTSQ
jgi:hypothetical protein